MTYATGRISPAETVESAVQILRGVTKVKGRVYARPFTLVHLQGR